MMPNGEVKPADPPDEPEPPPSEAAAAPMPQKRSLWKAAGPGAPTQTPSTMEVAGLVATMSQTCTREEQAACPRSASNGSLVPLVLPQSSNEQNVAHEDHAFRRTLSIQDDNIGPPEVSGGNLCSSTSVHGMLVSVVSRSNGTSAAYDTSSSSQSTQALDHPELFAPPPSPATALHSQDDKVILRQDGTGEGPMSSAEGPPRDFLPLRVTPQAYEATHQPPVVHIATSELQAVQSTMHLDDAKDCNGTAVPLAEGAESVPSESEPLLAGDVRPVGFSMFGHMFRAFRAGDSPVSKTSIASSGFGKSSVIVQAALNIARNPAARQHHRLSLKVMCGSGSMCIYHCGGNIVGQSSKSAGFDDKLARWEYFLGDSAFAPMEDELGRRQTIAQISAIEDHADAGDVIISKEMLEAIDERHADAELLSGGAARLFAVPGTTAEQLEALHVQLSTATEQFPSHVAARAAALFRMHVVDNVRQRIEAGHYDFINEIRQLTILFMGFPSLKEPDASLAHQLQPVQDTVMAVNRVMHQFQGSFVQFRCDEKGFLAICAFGLPGVSHANNPERGILAALLTQRLVEQMGQRFACGVTTGALLCACVGSKVRSEYTMFGDAINLSARLMCKAKAGLGIVITDEPTSQKAITKVEYEALTPLMLKGKARETKVLSVLLFLCLWGLATQHRS
jgi:hypothetical protein